jgi:hypothetical protein
MGSTAVRKAVFRALNNAIQREAGTREVAAALTPRELQVVGMIVKGARNKEIAERLPLLKVAASPSPSTYGRGCVARVYSAHRRLAGSVLGRSNPLTEGRGWETARDTRFPLVVPMEYRHVREPGWHEGRTVNVSGSGVLFEGPQGLQAGAQVELCLALHDAAPGLAPDKLLYTGRIMRVARAAAEPSGAMMAAQFEDCRFEHGLDADQTSFHSQDRGE